jgi:hypothetical protein
MTLQSDILLFRLKPWPDSSPPCFGELGVDGRDEERMLANLKKNRTSIPQSPRSRCKVLSGSEK